MYRVSIKSFPDYKHLLQENYVEYKHIYTYIYIYMGYCRIAKWTITVITYRVFILSQGRTEVMFTFRVV
jgi:hypothetical protein